MRTTKNGIELTIDFISANGKSFAADEVQGYFGCGKEGLPVPVTVGDTVTFSILKTTKSRHNGQYSTYFKIGDLTCS